jgi:integrase/recombinase XerD
MARAQGLRLRPEAWPEADQAAWARANAAGDLLEPGGRGARWRPATRAMYRDAYGCALAWLKAQGLLDTAPTPALWSREAVAAYAGWQCPRVCPTTVRIQLVGLACALQAMYPAQRWDHLRSIIKALPPARPSPRKRLQQRHSGELIALGERLMRSAEGLPPRQAALAWRDGLIVLWLACRPLRARNLAALELGRSLLRDGSGWRILFAGGETKTHSAIDEPVPEMLLPGLERYLAQYRPILGGPSLPPDQGPLWVASHGEALGRHRLALVVGERTLAAFGVRLGPHAFRRSGATTTAIEMPDQVRIAAAALGHRQFGTTQQHYNLAQSLTAAEAYLDVLHGLRDR